MLAVDVGDALNLGNAVFFFVVVSHKVGGYSDGEFPADGVVFECWKAFVFPRSSYDDIEFIVGKDVIGGLEDPSPAFAVLRFLEIAEFDFVIELNAKNQRNFEKNELELSDG